MNDDYQQPRLRVGVDQHERYAKIWRFELTSALSAGGSADAKRLDWNGEEFSADALTFTVHAPFLKHSAANGLSGRAIFMHDAGRWEVLEIVSYDRIYGLATGAVTGGDFTIDTVVSMSGATPVDGEEETVSVKNPFKYFGDDNAPCIAVWNQSNSLWYCIGLEPPSCVKALHGVAIGDLSAIAVADVEKILTIDEGCIGVTTPEDC